MKSRIILGMALVTALTITGGLEWKAAYAATRAKAETDATGVVTDNGLPAGGAVVTGACRGIVKHDTTDASASYLIVFTVAECPASSDLRMMATHENKTARATSIIRTISSQLTVAKADISFIGNAINVETRTGNEWRAHAA